MSTRGRLRSALAGRLQPLLTRERLALGGAVTLVALVRSLPLPAVFRADDVVLSSNDPHYYRFQVERLTAEATSVLDLGVLADLPPPVADGEPLTVALLWVVAELLGGGATVVGWVLAWYPVVTAVLTALLVYRVSVVLTADRRVGLAAVGLLAVVPGHAFRTGLGFADHHAMDYLLLALTLAALVEVTARDRTDGHPWLAVGALGLGVGGQVLAWEAGALLLLPAAVSMVAVAAVAARRPNPVARLSPHVAGFALGTVLAAGGHLLAGWHDPVAVAAPALLTLGTVGLAVGATSVARAGLWRPGTMLVGLSTLAACLAAAAVSVLAPGLVAELSEGTAFLLETQGIAETTSLVAGFGPVFGPLIMLGFVPVLGLPAAVWGVVRGTRRGEAAWVLVAGYVALFFGLSLLQRRFVGELAAPLSVFAGVGLVALLGWLDLVAAPAFGTFADGTAPDELDAPDRRRSLVLGLFGVTVAGFPALYAAVIHDRVVPRDAAYEASRAMRAYADERGWAYPRRYVFSDWGRNRLYNQVVSGRGSSYTFAQEHFSAFLSSREPDDWYDFLRDRTGFVVTTSDPPARTGTLGSVYELLHRRLGSDDGHTGVGHYRVLCVAGDGAVKAFALVPGARVVGRAGATERVTARTEVALADATVEYERTVRADQAGAFEVRVAHPGEYRVAGRSVTVPERAVRDGAVVRLDDPADG